MGQKMYFWWMLLLSARMGKSRNRSPFIAYNLGNARTAAIPGRMFPCWKKGNCKLSCL